MILNDHFYWLLVRKLSHDKIAPQSKVDVIDVDTVYQSSEHYSTRVISLVRISKSNIYSEVDYVIFK